MFHLSTSGGIFIEAMLRWLRLNAEVKNWRKVGSVSFTFLTEREEGKEGSKMKFFFFFKFPFCFKMPPSCTCKNPNMLHNGWHHGKMKPQARPRKSVCVSVCMHVSGAKSIMANLSYSCAPLCYKMNQSVDRLRVYKTSSHWIFPMTQNSI